MFGTGADWDNDDTADTEPRLIRIEAGPVLCLLLHNPQRLNAVTVSMVAEMRAAMAEISDAPGLRAAILAGTGSRAFTTGGDMTEFKHHRETPAQIEHYRAEIRGLTADIAASPVPVIAAVSGHCIGAGLGIALAAQLRFATPSARFGLPGARIGGSFDMDGLRRLTTLVGPAVARQMAMTADPLDGATAAACGLVNRCFALETCEDEVSGIAHRIASRAPLSVAAMSRAIGVLSGDLSAGAASDAAEALAACALSEDHREGRAAFAEKRPPSSPAAREK